MCLQPWVSKDDRVLYGYHDWKKLLKFYFGISVLGKGKQMNPNFVGEEHKKFLHTFKLFKRPIVFSKSYSKGHSWQQNKNVIKTYEALLSPP